MRASSILGALLLPALSFAAPAPSKDGYFQCLSAGDAAYLVSGFASLLTDFQASVANAILADDFTDTSDSINFLAGIPLGSVTFPSKAAFIAGQGAQPPIGFDVLNIDAVTCNVIAFRWVASVGSQQFPVKGINILYASKSSSGWQIDTVYSEFNSGAWVNDIGGTCTPPAE